MTINLVSLLIGFLVFFLVAYGARLVIRHLGAPAPTETIVMLILLVIFIVWLLQELGISGPIIHIGSSEGIEYPVSYLLQGAQLIRSD